MQSLTAPTALASKTMEQYGINVFDAQGNFTSMEDVAGQLQTRLGGLDEQTRSAALGAIFGAEAANVAGTLYGAGAKGVEEWTDKVNDQGYAAEQAYRMTDNLVGDIEQLGGAFDSALIKTGSNANDTLRDMVQVLTALVDWYSNLDPAMQATALTIGVVTTAVLVGGGAFLLAVPKIAQYRVALQTLNTEMPKTAAAAGRLTSLLGGPFGVALALAVALTGSMAASQAQAKARVDALRDSLDQQTGAVSENTREMVKKRLEDEGVFEAAKKAGVGLDVVTDAALGNKAAIEEVNAAALVYLDEGGRGITDLTSGQAFAYDKLTDNVRYFRNDLDKAKVSLEDNKAAGDGNAVAVESQADAYLAANDEASGLLDTLDQLIATINEANGIGQDAVSANADYQASLAGISEEVQRQKDEYEEAHKTLNGFNLSLNEGTVAGSANATMLSDVAASAQDAALAQYEVDKTTMGAKAATEKYNATLATNRQAFIDGAIEAGYNADEVQKLADKVFALPSQKEIDILADTAAASGSLDALVAKYNGVKITAELFLDSSNGDRAMAAAAARYTGQALYYAAMPQADGGVVDYYANGGFSERHVAQIAHAGAMRVWAEPETGGEAYIPLSPTKRGRSLEIWEETGRRLGVQGFADGGFYDGQPAVTYAQGQNMTGPLIGSLTLQSSGNVRADLEETLFHIRRIGRGGLHR